MTTLTTREVREHLAEVLERARYNEPTTITNKGEAIAAIVPIRALKVWEQHEIDRLRAIAIAAKESGPAIPIADYLRSRGDIPESVIESLR